MAQLEDGRLAFKGHVLTTDGSERFEIEAEGSPDEAERLGREAGRELGRRLPEGVLPKS